MAAHKSVRDIPLPEDSASLNLALQESQGFETGDLEKAAKKNEHQRREKFKDHFHWAIIIAFWLSFSVIVAAGVIWAYHLITPEKLHFLSPIEVGKIQTLLFGSVISGVLSVLTKNKYL